MSIIKRPCLWMAFFAVGGIVSGLPETPAEVKTAVAVFLTMCAVMAAEGPVTELLKKKKVNNEKGRGNVPLLFLSAEIIIFSALFLTGCLRARSVAAKYHTADAESFFKKYEPSNTGEFNYALYLKGCGISSEEERKKTGNTPALMIREFCGNIIEEAYNEKDSGIVKSLLTGDRTELDGHVSNLYKSSGISHLLAVSGLHVTILGMGLFKLLRKTALSKKAAGAISSAVMICFLFICDVPGSAERAVVMLIMSFIALMTGRTYDMKSALCIALMLMSIQRPYIVFQSGFQLSFTAVAAIGCAGEYAVKQIEDTVQNHEPVKTLYRSKPSASSKEKQTARKRILKENRLPDDGKLLIISAAVQLITLPVIIYNYYSFPLYAAVINLIVIPLISAVMYSGLAVLTLGTVKTIMPFAGPLFSVLETAAAAPGHYILRLYEMLCILMKSLPGSSICFGRPRIKAVILYYAVILLALFLMKMNPKKRLRGLALLKSFSVLGACAAAALLLKTRPPAAFFVAALDVGQGDCFYINEKNTKILIDGGASGYDKVGSNIIEPFLLSQGIRKLDAVIVSHADEDHVNGIKYLLSGDSGVSVLRLYLPQDAEYSDEYDELKEIYRKNKKNGRIIYLHSGDDIIINENQQISLKCLYSGDKSVIDDINRHSSVILLEKDDFSMLFTGDSTKEDELKMYQMYGSLPKTDVLKAGHHGSKTSTSDLLLKNTLPEYALLSFGENNRYRHPSEETVARLRRYNVKLLSTAEYGEIRIIPEPDPRNLNLSYKQIKTVVFKSPR